MTGGAPYYRQKELRICTDVYIDKETGDRLEEIRDEVDEATEMFDLPSDAEINVSGVGKEEEESLWHVSPSQMLKFSIGEGLAHLLQVSMLG